MLGSRCTSISHIDPLKDFENDSSQRGLGLLRSVLSTVRATGLRLTGVINFVMPLRIL
ncbi:hypothetical protein FIBSPDRAFT_869857, partial [Athelia psychrophila]